MRTFDLAKPDAEVGEIALGETSPLRLQRDGRDVAIVLPSNLYEMLLKPEPETVRPVVAALLRRTLIEGADVFRALAWYEREHPDE